TAVAASLAFPKMPNQGNAISTCIRNSPVLIEVARRAPKAATPGDARAPARLGLWQEFRDNECFECAVLFRIFERLENGVRREPAPKCVPSGCLFPLELLGPEGIPAIRFDP